MTFGWQLVSDPTWWGFGMMDEDGESSIRLLSKWLGGSLREWISDLLAIFWRWNLIRIIPAMASIPMEGEVLNAPKIQIAALLCILLRVFM